MKSLDFKLKEGVDFIPLNKLLQTMGYAQTGGHAKIMILNKEIEVNGQVETRIRKKLVENDQVQFDEHIIVIKR